jgi:hypothetical protein
VEVCLGRMIIVENMRRRVELWAQLGTASEPKASEYRDFLADC